MEYGAVMLIGVVFMAAFILFGLPALQTWQTQIATMPRAPPTQVAAAEVPTQALIQQAGPPFDWMIVVYVIVGIIVAYFVVLKGIFLVRDHQVGILTKRFGGKSMPPGQIIARRGEVGVQAKTLMPGLYWRFPLFWSVKKAAIVKIETGKLGIVESIDGERLKPGRLLADAVECNHFQNAEAFLDNHGMKGFQIPVLTPGEYRINTEIFKVTIVNATKVDKEKTGLVTALDGQPLPKEFMIAPKPIEAPTAEYKNARPHKFFQDGQAFVDSAGYRGPQEDTLQPGEYYINTKLFTVEVVDIQEVPPGFVGILRSNIGPHSKEEPPADKDTPSKTDSDAPVDKDEQAKKAEAQAQAAMALIEDKRARGILKHPVLPGKYNLNTVAYTPYLVPTSAVTIDWAAGTDSRMDLGDGEQDRRQIKRTTHDEDLPQPPLYKGSALQKALDFFRFSQLKVTSKDGFELGVDVRMVIRILPEDAAWVIARFGSVENLIQQIVHPLIDSSFRNKAGESKAIDFIQSRAKLQQEALQKAEDEFKKYHVEAQNLLIAYIDVDDALLKTQTDKEIAVQLQETLKEQANAENQRIETEKKRAEADKQKDVVAAKLQIDINKNHAQAEVEKAKGDRDARIERATGEAKAIEAVGNANATAYRAQSEVLGEDNLTLVQVMDRVKDGKVKITPDTLVTGGDGNAGQLLSAFFAKHLSGDKQKPASEDPQEPVKPAPEAKPEPEPEKKQEPGNKELEKGRPVKPEKDDKRSGS